MKNNSYNNHTPDDNRFATGRSVLADRRKIESDISPLMKKTGFKKKGIRWFYETSETILILELQKSYFGELYYINLSIYFKEFEPIVPSLAYAEHLGIRLYEFLTNDESKYKKYLDMEEYSMTYEEKIGWITNLISERAIPMLMLFKTLEKSKEVLKNYEKYNIPKSLLYSALKKGLYEFLEIQDPRTLGD